MEFLFPIIIFVIIVVVAFLLKQFPIETPAKKAGRLGEMYATSIIEEVQNKNDVLLTKVEIAVDGKRTELDNVVINDKGVFIIEVKNHSGQLSGDEDDFEWIQSKVTEAGNLYQKNVKNPIGQVKRQIFLLSELLKNHGIRVWIKGYVFFVERNSPVNSEYVLETRKDIDTAIHSRSKNHLNKKMIEEIRKLLR
ncbi:MAG: NERD domain-containing protein [Spirochaetia bacterium]|nr:NERD domain-containing protein [Spirochaetia bacterium]MBR5017246.1 NERD domain-containing protein [Spirochaetia bacterium]